MSVMVRSTLRIDNYTAHVGATISGVDLTQETSDADYAAIVAALDERGVIFLRDQPLDTAQFKAFGRRFGTLIERDWQLVGMLAGEPAVQVIAKEADAVQNIGDEWHSDQAYRTDPPKITALIGRQIPPYGGDTCFLNMSAAFEALPDAMKDMLRPMRAVQSRPRSMRKVMGLIDPDAATAHLRDEVNVKPVVMQHPVTGREILFINPSFTASFEGWSEDESAPLLEQLHRHCQRPEYQCRFRWRENSIVLWDNRQMLHYAVNDYHGFRREMHRLVIR